MRVCVCFFRTFFCSFFLLLLFVKRTMFLTCFHQHVFNMYIRLFTSIIRFFRVSACCRWHVLYIVYKYMYMNFRKCCMATNFQLPFNRQSFPMQFTCFDTFMASVFVSVVSSFFFFYRSRCLFHFYQKRCYFSMEKKWFQMKITQIKELSPRIFLPMNNSNTE